MTSTATATAPRRRERGPADYIFRPRNSNNWWIKLRHNGERIEHSLGTADRTEALAKAEPEIQEHRLKKLAARPRYEAAWAHKLTPRALPYPGNDGELITAGERELSIFAADGVTLLRKEPNGGIAYRLAGDVNDVRALAVAAINADFGDGPAPRTLAPKRNSGDGDDAILQAYLDFGGKDGNGVHGHFRREAEAVWATFKRLTENKPLAKCTRDDGRLLVAHFKEQKPPLKQATIRKKLMWLVAAVNLAIADGKLTNANPFSGLVKKPKKTPEDRRFSLEDADMELCRQNLGKLRETDQKLFRFLATTGARLEEAFQFEREEAKAGIRCVTIGTKSEGSLRTIPLPDGVLPFLPPKITAPVFPMLEGTKEKTAAQRTAAAASKRLNRFLRDIGITDPRKVIHSLRHRAEDQLREADCPKPIANVLLGHGGKDVDDDYGHVRFSTAKRKQWIDKIGM